MENFTECKYTIMYTQHSSVILVYYCDTFQVGRTVGSEKLLSTAERYALVIASVGNVSNSEQQYRQRKSRANIGEKDIASHCLLHEHS